jgi:hypothetical protein
LYAGVVQLRRTTQQSSQALLRTDVVPGENLQAAKPAEQDVLSRPSPHAPQSAQLCRRLSVVNARQPFEIDFTAFDGQGQCPKRSSFLPAEANRPIRGWR